MRRVALFSLCLFGLHGLACGGGDKKMPPPPPPPPPTRLMVHVVDATNAMPIDKATFILLEEGRTRTTTASGTLLFDVMGGNFTYRADAPKYLASPRPGHALGRIFAPEHVTTELTVRLEPRPMAADGGSLSGQVMKQGAPVPGALVVASSVQSYSTHTDGSGAYTITAVPPGLYQVTAYVQGYMSTTKMNISIATAADARSGVNLDLMPTPGATVSGRLTGGTGTSSIGLYEAETGEPIPHLNVQANLGDRYSIGMVPPGKYVIRAGLEDVGFTLDPEAVLINGQPSVTITDTASKTVDLTFVAAIKGIMPATSSTVAAPPMFSWPTVQDAAFYVVEVRDVTGHVLWGGFDPSRHPRNPVTSPTTSARYAGDALAPGTLYSWRLYAAKEVTTGMLFTLISASEELGGEFRIAR